MMLSSPTGSSCTCQMKNSKSLQWTCSSGWRMMDISSSVSHAIILQEIWKTLKTQLCTDNLRYTLISFLLSKNNFLMVIFQRLKWWPNVQWRHMLRYVVTYSNWELGFKRKYKAKHVHFQGNAGRVENINLLLEGYEYFILNNIMSLCLVWSDLLQFNVNMPKVWSHNRKIVNLNGWVSESSVSYFCPINIYNKSIRETSSVAYVRKLVTLISITTIFLYYPTCTVFKMLWTQKVFGVSTKDNSKKGIQPLIRLSWFLFYTTAQTKQASVFMVVEESIL